MSQNMQQITLAKHGDVNAFAELYRDIYLDLYRFALYALKHQSDAEDAVSETVIDAFTSIQKLRREESFKAWMFKILSAKCKRRLKSRSQAFEAPSSQISNDNSFDRLAEHMDVRDCFFQLNDVDRLIISMHIFAGYTNQEIAKALHMNPNTVRSRESRALKKLSEQLSGQSKKER